MEDAVDRPVQPPSAPGPLASRVLHRLEESLLLLALALATLLPLVETIGRPLGGLHIRGSSIYVQHITLWLAFLAGTVAVRERQHLTLSTASFLGPGRLG